MADRMAVFTCCLAALILLSRVATAAEALMLVHEGRPRAAIVLPAKPTRAAQLAAFELRHHIRLITGAELPLVREGGAAGALQIHVGETRAAVKAGLGSGAFKPQEYAVRFTLGVLYLVGRDATAAEPVTYDPEKHVYGGLPSWWKDRGPLDAAYDLLEKLCGVRWLNPTRFGTFLPRTRTLTVMRRNIRRAPAFEYRDAMGAGGDAAERYSDIMTFWPRNSIEQKGWDKLAHADLHALYKHPHRYRGAVRQRSHLFLLRRRNGGRLQRCNHSLYGYYKRFWDDPKKRRPELFAKGYEGKPPQLCYSSRALVEQVADDARHYYDTGDHRGIFWRPRHPNWFPVEPMDNRSYCKCADCQAWLAKDTEDGKLYSTGSHSDYFFQFVNAVARELRQTHPDKSVVTLAYSSHARLPQRVKLDASVAVHFCFASNRSARGRHYEHEVGLLKQWASDGSGRPLYLWLYYTFPLERARNANLACWPGAFAHTIGDQMRLFKRLGYRGMFHCGYGQEVEGYLTFRLMDDPALDVDSLLDEYFTGIYGGAAEPMKQWYREVERSYMGEAAQYTEPRMAELAALVRKAEAAARTEAEKCNVALFKLGTWAYMEEGMRQRLMRRKTPIPALTVPRVPDAGGKVAKVAWDKALPLKAPWYRNNSYVHTDRKVSGRIAHDGTHLYLELIDVCDTAGLQSSAMVFPKDTWEVFIAAQRGLPYRQYASNPAGLTVGLSHGEVNFRRNVQMDKPPFTVTSDKSARDRWVTRMAWPLGEILPGGVKTGGKLYMNIIRVWELPNRLPDGAGIDVWAPFTKVHDMSRAPELTLAEEAGQ